MLTEDDLRALGENDIEKVRALRDQDPPSWTFYGFIDHGATVEITNKVSGPAQMPVRTGLVKDQLPTLDAAIVEAKAAVASAGTGKVVGVIVQLDHGHDINGQRHVIHRMNGGKGWWE